MKGNVVARSSIDPGTRSTMYALFQSQFESVPFEQFSADLDEKNWVLLLRRDDGALIGFSCMHFYDIVVDGEPLTVIYSGDTVIDPETWSDSALSYYWMGAVDYLRRLHGKESVYWFLLVSGYRTYRFLPVYSTEYYPRLDRPTPEKTQRIMDTMASQRFGSAYDPAAGVVRFNVPPVLRDGLRGIPENRLSDPHVAFFNERNPGHEAGDELVCFSMLSESTLTRLGVRMWRKGKALYPDVVEA